ncbi:MAG: hypothetical protein JW717_11090 [Marinilabiliaceae bacterium]|nr:hypothetical protein [Marinilabiliaceae bacterium]
MKTYPYILIVLFFTLVINSCKDLEIINENDPDFATATSNPSDLKGVASGLYNYYYMSVNQYDPEGVTDDRNTPAYALWVIADAGTCSWGNSGMKDMGNEPRLPFDNSPSYENKLISEEFYSSMNSLVSSSNDILIQTIKNNAKIETEGVDETPMVNAMAYFARGIGLGYLGLLYDKAYVITENSDLTGVLEYSSYKIVIDSAIASLEKSIKICENNSFIIPSSWIPCSPSLTNDNLGKLVNSFAARILGNSPRNKVENDSLDWNEVYNYASKGIDFDFKITMDDIKWYNLYYTYSNMAGWGQVDMRVINMLDPDMPSKWPGANGYDVIPVAKDSAKVVSLKLDYRLVTDYEFLSSCPFKPDRGYYYFSCYRYKRYDDYLETWTEPLIDFHESENEMMLAEALLMLNKLPEAANIINNGTRTIRGKLPNIDANYDEIAGAIFHERNVELMNSNIGTEFFAMRKSDMLQNGSFLHFPIPGAQLEVQLMDYYTFGGKQGVPGIDVSVGGWEEK